MQVKKIIPRELQTPEQNIYSSEKRAAKRNRFVVIKHYTLKTYIKTSLSDVSLFLVLHKLVSISLKDLMNFDFDETAVIVSILPAVMSQIYWSMGS
jgi:hypothetical protein